MNAEEYLDIVDGEGEPTGRTKARSLVHRDGDLHRTSHVWIARRKGGRLQLLLQKRSRNKDSHPGCYDISSAGHIPAGSDFEDSALRELKEELGVDAEAGGTGVLRRSQNPLGRSVLRKAVFGQSGEPGIRFVEKSGDFAVLPANQRDRGSALDGSGNSL